MDSFIARANIRHFGDRLRTESDGEMRCRLQKLLIEEEDKLGQDLAVIVEVERTITGLDVLIENQAAIVAKFNGREDDDCKRSKKFLDGLIETHTLYKGYHRRLVGAARTNQS